MSEQDSPQVDAARYVIPFDVDLSEAESKMDEFLDRVETRVEAIVARLGEAGGVIPLAQPRDTSDDTPRESGSMESSEDTGELKAELKALSSGMTELKQAVDELAETMNALSNQGEL